MAGVGCRLSMTARPVNEIAWIRKPQATLIKTESFGDTSQSLLVYIRWLVLEPVSRDSSPLSMKSWVTERKLARFLQLSKARTLVDSRILMATKIFGSNDI